MKTRLGVFLMAALITTPAWGYWIRDCRTQPGVWSSQTSMVADINPGPDDTVKILFGFAHRHEYMIEFDGNLFFQASNPGAGAELWRVKPNGAPTQVADIAPGAASSSPHAFVVFQSRLFFAATSPKVGEEIFRFDGATALAVETVPGSEGAELSSLTVYNNAIYFLRTFNGKTELWRYDGASNAGPVSAVNATPGSVEDTNLNATPFAVYKSKLYFVKRTPLPEHFELWSYDGSATAKVMALTVGNDIIERRFTLAVYKDRLTFGVVTPKDDIFDQDELWRYDGVNPPAKVFTFPGNAYSYSQPTDFAVLNGNLFFSAASGFWRFDGANTTELTTGPGALPYGIDATSRYPTANRLFVSGFYDDWTASEPYLFDGTTAALLKNIMPDNHDYPGSFPSRALDVNGALFFYAQDADHGRELWRTSGKAGVPILKCDIVVAPIWDDWRLWPIDRREVVVVTWAINPAGRRMISREVITVTPEEQARVTVLELNTERQQVPDGFALATVVFDRESGRVVDSGYDIVGTPDARQRRQLERTAAALVKRATMREALAAPIQRE